MPVSLTLRSQGREMPLMIGGGSLSQAGELLMAAWPHRRVLLLTDAGVIGRMGMRVELSLRAAGFDVTMLLLPLGNAAKAPHQLLRVLTQLDARRFSRLDGVLALGGGAVMDMAALASSMYLGGTPFAAIPTTPASAISCATFSPGCMRLKSGLDGAFALHSPDFVLIDPEALTDLPEPVRLSGLGELLRLCALTDRLPELIDWGEHPPWESVLPELLPRVAALAGDDKRPLELGWPLCRAIDCQTKGALPYGVSGALSAMLMTSLTQRMGLSEQSTREAMREAASSLRLPLSLPKCGTLRYKLERDPMGLSGGQSAPYLIKIGAYALTPITLQQLKGAATWTA